MNDLQIFENVEFGKIGVLVAEGKEFFPATECAKILGYKNPHEAIRTHCKGVREFLTPTSGGEQKVKFISDGDLFRLIARSNLPTAERFEFWVFDEVLPTIRKTGGYVANDDLFIKTYLPHADEATKLMFKTTLSTVRKLSEENASMKPKAEYFDALVNRNLLLNFRDTAKTLKVGEKIFIQWLQDKKYIYRDIKGKPKPYSQYVPDLFNLKEWTRNETSGSQTLITPRGREIFRLLLIKEEII